MLLQHCLKMMLSLFVNKSIQSLQQHSLTSMLSVWVYMLSMWVWGSVTEWV